MLGEPITILGTTIDVIKQHYIVVKNICVIAEQQLNKTHQDLIEK